MRSLPYSKYWNSAMYQFTNFVNHEYIYPFYASYKITNKCDRRCEFCNVHIEKTPTLGTEEVFRVIDNVARSSIFLLSLEGGDPLLRKDIREILKYQADKPFFLLFTTSGEQFSKIDMEEYGRYIDFLHISIDEGHKNAYLYDELENFTHWGPIVCAQIVVRNIDMEALEGKIQRCYTAGAKAVVMPACHIPNTENMLPSPEDFTRLVLYLKKKYPNTIINPDRYLKNFNQPHSCTTASIIIDCDGHMFYPCRTREQKPFSLLERPLTEIVNSREAHSMRMDMNKCDQLCHWYQYFATDSFLSIEEFYSSIKPYIGNLVADSALKNNGTGNNGGSGNSSRGKSPAATPSKEN